MVKVLKMENLECAKIEGVHSVSISFMAQKMILDCEDGDEKGILEKVREAVRSVEKDCVVK